MKELLKKIMNPGEEFTPVPFWFFNDAPDMDKIRRQLEDYVEKGVNGIVLHPRIGIPENVPYLSECYFTAVKYIVKTADELNMKVVLYDEGMYPSGSAHGMVVAANPEYASRGITVRQMEREAVQNMVSGEILEHLEDGRCLVYDVTGGTIRGIHFGEDDWEAGAPASADILNPDAVDLFIHLTHDQYYEHLKEYFGKTVIAFFTDEPSPLGRNAMGFHPWVKGMEQEIAEQGGRLQDLFRLFDETDRNENEEKTLSIYHRLIKKHLREIFYGRLSSWCSAHGIALIGHPEVSDDVEEQLYFQIPGQDLIMRRVVPKTGGLLEFDSVQAKLAADIARHLGRRRNANECFGVCCRNQIPWYFTAEDMKWYIDWLGVRGVNLYIPHAFYYSVEGARKDERPPDVGPNNIWWKHYRRFSDYMKRLSYLMTDSVNGARVAVLCDNNRVPVKEVAALYESQVEFNYLPVGLLEHCQLRDGKLCIQDYAYEAVYDPLELTEQKTGLEKNLEEILDHSVWRSIKLLEECRTLRAVRLQKDDADMLLLTNEGADTVCVKWKPEEGTVSAVLDLWQGSCDNVFRNSGQLMELELAPCETRLYILRQGDDLKLPAGKDRSHMRWLGDWTETFVLTEELKNQRVYDMTFTADCVDRTEYFTVTGEEMVECFCNDRFVDVSFWNIHRFEVGKYLQIGENRIRLVVTGNAANLFSEADIAFGLGIRG